MAGKEISDIIITTCLFGWIPILTLFSGITKVITAIKGNNINNGGINIDRENKPEEYEEEEK